ncbi:MAG: hypothetical protein ACKO2G_08110 [Verrucomicrobiales bacterium]
MEPGPNDRPGLSGWNRPPVVAAVVTILLLLAWLAFAPKPWNEGIAAAEANGRAPKTIHYAISGLWYGSLAALPLAFALLPVTRAMRRKPSEIAPPIEARIVPRGSWLPIVIAAIGIAAVLAKSSAPRLEQSLWDDEEKALRYFTVGRCSPDKNGAMKFTPATWLDAFFNYRQPNNHILFTILSKASHQASGHRIDTPGQPYFNERALRLPAFFAGLAAVGGLGLALWLIGHPRAGLWAMPLLSFHPWFLRYLVEARGYSLILLLGPLTAAALWRALAGGRAGWWAGFAIGQFALLYTFPGSVHTVFWMNVAALAWIVFSSSARPWRAHLLPRWLAANLWSAIVLIVLMAPAVPQMLDYLRENRDSMPFNTDSARNVASLLLSGSTWNNWDPSNPLALGLKDMLASDTRVALSAAAVFAAMIAGLVHCLRSHRSFLWLWLILLLPAVSFPIHAWLEDHPFYSWYAVGTLPFLCGLAALGVEGIASFVPSAKLRQTLTLVLGLALTLAGAGLTASQREITTSHPIEPKRDSFLLYRADAPNPFDARQQEIISIGFHQENITYDPGQRRLDDVKNQAAIDELIAEAARTGKPLYVDFAQEAYARVHFQEIFKRLDNPDLFERVVVLHGLEPQNTRVVLRYIGSPEREIAP